MVHIPLCVKGSTERFIVCRLLLRNWKRERFIRINGTLPCKRVNLIFRSPCFEFLLSCPCPHICDHRHFCIGEVTKIHRKFEFSLKSDNNKGQFTWTNMIFCALSIYKGETILNKVPERRMKHASYGFPEN
jgi:hypothetical protein